MARPSHPPNADSPPKRPRLADVAKMCGVSAATVSRVLNQDAKFSARPEVRQRILEAAATLGYAPDLTARNLIRGKTQIIGVFGSPEMQVGEGINNDAFAGIADAVRDHDYDVFFELTSHHATDSSLPSWRFDGAILVQAPPATLIDDLDHRRIPYVTINEPVGQPVASILTDDVGGTLLAMNHLADLGHRRIAYANAYPGYFRHYSITERHGTIVSFCQEHGLTLVPGHDADFQDGEAFLKNAVEQHHATAVICYDHRIAISVLGASYRLGIPVPGTMSLLCYNDLFPVDRVYPAITTVAVNAREMGRRAARVLIEIMDGQTQPDDVTPVRLDENLIVRDSTAPPPAN